MKAIFEFSLPDDELAYNLCNNSGKAFNSLYQIKERLHGMRKCGFSNDIKTAEQMLEHIIEIFDEETELLDILKRYL